MRSRRALMNLTVATGVAVEDSCRKLAATVCRRRGCKARVATTSGTISSAFTRLAREGSRFGLVDKPRDLDSTAHLDGT
jgi:hypothetical protein